MRSYASRNVSEPWVKKVALRAQRMVSNRAPVFQNRLSQTWSLHRDDARRQLPTEAEPSRFLGSPFLASGDPIGQFRDQKLAQLIVGASGDESEERAKRRVSSGRDWKKLSRE